MAEQVTVFHWAELATNAVCDRLVALAGDNAAATPRVRQVVSHILSHVGGLPVLRGVVDEERLEQIAVGVLHEAFRHTLSTLGASVERRGFESKSGMLTAIDRVKVNTADAGQLEKLPVIGPRTAELIVEDRSLRGPFPSMKELAGRIPGIGDRDLIALEGRLSFASPEANVLRYDRIGLDDCLALLLNAHASDAAGVRLIRALETVASICATSPHPATREKRIRAQVFHDGVVQEAAEVHLMNGGSYYQTVQEVLEQTNNSISVAMFHIAMPEENHPTRQGTGESGRRLRGIHPPPHVALS